MITRSLRRLRPRRVARAEAEDQALALRLYETFEADLAAAELPKLAFYVRDGVIVVRGEVRDDLDRDLLVTLVEAIPHVATVVDDLTVQERMDG